MAGITGGIGSGKSTIAKVLSLLGYPVFIADKSAAEIVSSDPEVRRKLAECFGETIFLSSGELDKAKMAALIFTDPGAREKVNSIVHPAVWKAFILWCSRQTSRIVFMESAIIFECGWSGRFDTMICVTAEEATRIKRAAARDSADEADIVRRIRNQMPDSEKVRLAEYTIHTDEHFSELDQLFRILHSLNSK